MLVSSLLHTATSSAAAGRQKFSAYSYLVGDLFRNADVAEDPEVVASEARINMHIEAEKHRCQDPGNSPVCLSGRSIFEGRKSAISLSEIAFFSSQIRRQAPIPCPRLHFLNAVTWVARRTC